LLALAEPVLQKLLAYLPDLRQRPFAISAAAVGVLLWAGLFAFPLHHPLRKPMHVGAGLHQDPQLAICFAVRNLQLPPEACFIKPFSHSGLRYHAQVAEWIDFRPSQKWRRFMELWYGRIRQVYGIHLGLPGSLHLLRPIADAYFARHTPESLRPLVAQGVTHMLTWETHKIAGAHQVAQAGAFVVYDLRPLLPQNPALANR
jgi:hypothetical protein